MEDPDSEETRRFVDEQNALSQPYIAACAEREEINKELTKLWNYPKYGVPHRQGQKYFFSKNSGLQNQRSVEKMEIYEYAQVSKTGIIFFIMMSVSLYLENAAFPFIKVPLKGAFKKNYYVYDCL